MKPVLLLIDLQNDFLGSCLLEPAAGALVDRAAALLAGCRVRGVPVVHVRTTVHRGADNRMPHWKRSGTWSCVAGTEGHAPPVRLRSVGSELVVHKSFFSAFSDGELDTALQSLGVDTIIVAGVHLHGCVRASVLDAYQRGFTVFAAEDALASDDPLHAAITQRYLAARAARFLPVEAVLSALDDDRRECCAPVAAAIPELPSAIIDGMALSGAAGDMVHVSPRHSRETLWKVPLCEAPLVARAAAAAQAAWPGWRTSPAHYRTGILERLADLLRAAAEDLARQMAIEIGKPLAQARAEVFRAVALIESVLDHAGEPLERRYGPVTVALRRPIGVVGMITPWNNPLAIPVGKLAPALRYGNTAVWKPAPHGSSLAVSVMGLLRSAGCPAGVVNLVCGDRSTASTLMADRNIDAVTITGGLQAGYSAQDICARRHLPLQAELGGNNAAIVWADCDLEDAAAQIAEAAFGFAGQRCTANRRVIVDNRCYGRFLADLESAVGRLAWDDPLLPTTQVGPLISSAACSRTAAIVERAAARARMIVVPHTADPRRAELLEQGAYFPPTIVCCDDPDAEVVQQETFGPVLVVQGAADWEEAMQRCNGVRQGLAAAIFSPSQARQSQFMDQARAGILKINRGTADAGADAPFVGWKASGIGPPEHGQGDREFYTRAQTVYAR